MNRSLAPLTACVALLSACDSPPPEDTALRWKPGVHYEVLAEPPAQVPGERTQVVEFFSYGCGWCYLLEPHLVFWNRSNIERVEFVQVPMQSRPSGVAHARLYYTLKALGRPDLHMAVFDAMHRDGALLETVQSQAVFAGRHGISEEDFMRAYDSALVKEEVAAADALMRQYKIDRVPSVVVGGRYKTSVAQAVGTGELVKLMTELVKRQ